METEIEGKFTNIDKEDIRTRLQKLGARLKQPERLMRRKNFDYPDGSLEKIGGWIRLRDESGKVTLAYKRLHDRTLHGTKEVSIEVNNFDKTADLLVAIGFEMKSYQETMRESWELEGSDIEIDTWPWIPPFVEIEAKDEQALKKTAEKLGFEWAQIKHGSVENVYQENYNVTEREVDAWKEIVFIDTPDWLVEKRRT
jgi:adenylate cyclase, class 2